MIYTLTELKRMRFADIDRRTAEVFARGYTYGGVTVSLEDRDLVYYHQLGELSSLLASITIPAADDMQPPLVLTTFLAIGPFVSGVKQYVRDVYAAEAVLKQAVRSAADQVAVEAIADNR